MDGVVTFNQQNWAARYPELAASCPNAQPFFDEATLYLSNDPLSIVRDVPRRAVLLNMLTAHIVYLNVALNCELSSQIVGRISNASEGSVSVATQNEYPPGSAQWYQQTKYGSAFWAATVNIRSARYTVPCNPNRIGPVGYGVPGVGFPYGTQGFGGCGGGWNGGGY